MVAFGIDVLLLAAALTPYVVKPALPPAPPAMQGIYTNSTVRAVDLPAIQPMPTVIIRTQPQEQPAKTARPQPKLTQAQS